MIPSTKLQLKLSQLREAINDFPEDGDAEDRDKLTLEYRDVDSQWRAAVVTEESEATAEVVETDSPEDREYRELRSSVDFGRYVAAAMGGHGVTNGPELELNQHLKIADGYFPMELLAGDEPEVRAAIDGEAATSQGTWLDRVFHGTAAEAVGISFRPVAPGVASFPVTTAGGAPQQRGRTQAATARTYTVAVTEIKPARRAVHGLYTIEDDARLPGLSAAIERDMRAAMVESVDLAVFKGDAGANEDTADVVGLQTAAVTEATLTQAKSKKADDVLKFFLEYVDGEYAASLSDVRIVASVGTNVLWYGSIHNSAADNQTIAQFLMASGVSWTARGGIDANTANGDFGAYIGLSRGIEGAGIAAVWEQGQLIRDPYSSAASGEVQLTLNYLFQVAFPRTDNFKRLKYVT